MIRKQKLSTSLDIEFLIKNQEVLITRLTTAWEDLVK